MSRVKAMSAVERIEMPEVLSKSVLLFMQEIRILTCRKSRRRQMA